MGKLVEVRGALADQLELFPHNLLSQQQLVELVLDPPASMEEVEEMLGEARAVLVGEGVLHALQEWRGERGEVVSGQQQQQQRNGKNLQQHHQQQQQQQQQQEQEDDEHVKEDTGGNEEDDQEYGGTEVLRKRKGARKGAPARRRAAVVLDESDEDEDFVPLVARAGKKRK